MVTESAFGRSEVESRLNVSTKEHARYHTLECVASTDEEEAYTLFSISGTSSEPETHRHTNPLTPPQVGGPGPGVWFAGYRLNKIRAC